MNKTQWTLQEATKSVLMVGEDGGRGFIVATKMHHYVITAAHCLPRLPIPHPLETEGRTYRDLIGPLGKKPCVWAECVFVDPVADIAVLAEPDDQGLPEQWDAFYELVNALRPHCRLRRHSSKTEHKVICYRWTASGSVVGLPIAGVYTLRMRARVLLVGCPARPSSTLKVKPLALYRTRAARMKSTPKAARSRDC
jgi:hypothetical protein